MQFSIFAPMSDPTPPEKFYRMNLKRMPRKIRNMILDETNEVKKTGIQFSMESALYKLLQTHPKYKEQ